MKKFFITLVIPFLASVCSLQAEVCGKVDAGPTYIHLDMLQSGKTIKRVDMGGVKVDSSIVFWKGLCVKPALLYGNGHGEIISVGGSFGHYTPFWDKWSATPAIGCMYTQLQTTLPINLQDLIPVPIPPMPRAHVKERLYSVSPYLSLDVSYCFYKGWRIIAVYQYSWSRTLTTLSLEKHLFPIVGDQAKNVKDWSHSEGSNYGLMIEGDINDKWSINIGAAYNLGLSKEKHGLRAYGCRVAVAYWF